MDEQVDQGPGTSLTKQLPAFTSSGFTFAAVANVPDLCNVSYTITILDPLSRQVVWSIPEGNLQATWVSETTGHTAGVLGLWIN